MVNCGKYYSSNAELIYNEGIKFYKMKFDNLKQSRSCKKQGYN